MITICFTYFRSLSLANLAAALYSVRQQNFVKVREIVLVDNDTQDGVQEIADVVHTLKFPVPVLIYSFKHNNRELTHAWSTNTAVARATASWILFTRADYLLDFEILQKFLEVVEFNDESWNGFITSNVYHLHVDIGLCEKTGWRRSGVACLQNLSGVENTYTVIDSGVWMGRREAFEQVRGLNERFTAWGHAQTHFQYKLSQIGTEFVRIPRVLFYHPLHAATRDLEIAHRQLKEQGVNLKEMWARYDGPQPY